MADNSIAVVRMVTSAVENVTAQRIRRRRTRRSGFSIRTPQGMRTLETLERAAATSIGPIRTPFGVWYPPDQD